MVQTGNRSVSPCDQKAFSSSSQYVAHRDEYRKRHATLDERSLFHGCTNDSADKIITECFNRSFAGVNGKTTSIET